MALLALAEEGEDGEFVDIDGDEFDKMGSAPSLSARRKDAMSRRRRRYPTPLP